MRLQPDYLDPQDRAVTVHSTLLMGFHLSIEDALPYDIAYDLAPITCTLVAKASHRQIQDVAVNWVVYDISNAVAARAPSRLRLKTGKRHATNSFHPPRFGWYTVIFEARHQGELLDGGWEILGRNAQISQHGCPSRPASPHGLGRLPGRHSRIAVLPGHSRLSKTRPRAARNWKEWWIGGEIRPDAVRAVRQRGGLHARERPQGRHALQGPSEILGDHE